MAVPEPPIIGPSSYRENTFLTKFYNYTSRHIGRRAVTSAVILIIAAAGIAIAFHKSGDAHFIDFIKDHQWVQIAGIATLAALIPYLLCPKHEDIVSANYRYSHAYPIENAYDRHCGDMYKRSAYAVIAMLIVILIASRSADGKISKMQLQQNIVAVTGSASFLASFVLFGSRKIPIHWPQLAMFMPPTDDLP